MECNKNEAMRAMEMAEQKFASQDYTGARKLALKAQQLFPALENIGQMIAVFDVHVAAQTRIGISEKDWYGILQIESTADDAVVKKQYRKLALFLHPDKNKSIGAESAFKLIGEALQVLSDKVKRLVYDAKRGMHARVNHTFSGSSDGVNNCWQSQLFQQQQQHHSDVANTFNKTSQRHFPQPPHVSPEFHLLTFWTVCTSCQMRYQYYRKYENQNLLCPQCRRPFIAKDLSKMQGTNFTQTWTPRAGESVLSGPPSSHMPTGYKSRPHTFANYSAPSCKYSNGFPSVGRSDTFPMFSGATASHMNSKVNASGDKNEAHYRRMQESGVAEKELLRKIKELHKSAAREQKKQNQLKKSTVNLKAGEPLVTKVGQGHCDSYLARKERFTNGNDDDSSSSNSKEDDEFWERVPVKEGNDAKANAGHLKRSSSYSMIGSVCCLQDAFTGKKTKFDTESGIFKQDLEAIDMAKKLADLAKNAIRVKLNLQRAKPTATQVAAGQAFENKEKNVPAIRVKLNLKRAKPTVTQVAAGQAFENKEKNVPGLKERREDNKTENVVNQDEVVASCSVPDADFHNFDEGREEKDVEVGQTWALYDDKDGMPRYYMKVKDVHSRSPFKVLIGWFELRKPSDELCELLDLGFSIACGEFRMSSSQVMDSVNSFSHLVSWERSGKGLVKIYPKKGQIWCIYRDWEAGQQVLRVGDGCVGYSMSMVEVLSDCCEASGASVRLLTKVEGFKSIFQTSKEGVFQVPFLELLRFSHRIPARMLQGNEVPGIPHDCWELDPAAVPSHVDQNGVTEAAT